MPLDLIRNYGQRVRDLRRANADIPETGLAPQFQQLLEQLLAALPLAPNLQVVPEFRNPGVGRPDIALITPGAPPRAFVELKAPGKSANPERWRDHDKRQYERFRELPCWASCNFAEIRLFSRDEELFQASIVPEQALRPEKSDAAANKLIAAHDFAPLMRLVEMLAQAASRAPAAQNAEHLAQLLAQSARLVRGIVRDRLEELRGAAIQQNPLLQVRQEFRDVLYAHPEAGGYPEQDFDILFSSAFAQTLAFGLLLVREATNAPVGRDAYQQMPPEHPLMRTALRVLTLEEVVRDIGIGFEIMRDCVNSFDPAILARGMMVMIPFCISTNIFLKLLIRMRARNMVFIIRLCRWCATWRARWTAPCAKALA